MKKLLFILMISSFCSFGQRMGLKAGLNIGKEKISSGGISVTSDASFFYMGGFFISENLTDDLSLGAELIYSLDGGKFDIPGARGTDRYHFLSVPVLFKYHASREFNIQIGPQVGYLLKAEAESGRQRVDFTSDVNPINVSAVIGAEANLRSFDLGVRYIMGFSDLNNTDDDSFEVMISTFQIYLGQTF